MKKRFDVDPWFQKTLEEVEKYLGLGVPLQIIYFPSSGFNASLDMASEFLERKKISTVMIDFDLEKKIGATYTENLNKKIDNQLEEILKTEKKTVFIFRNFKPDNKDFIFKVSNLNSQILNYNDHINIIIAVNSEIEAGFLPIDTYTHYFNYYFQPELDQSFEFSLKQILPEIDTKMVEDLKKITGSMPALARSILRETLLNPGNKDLFNTINIDENLAKKYPILSKRIDRIIELLDFKDISLLKKIAEKKKPNKSELPIVKKYLGLGFLNDKKEIRCKILEEYLKYIEPKKISRLPDSSEKIKLSSSVFLDRVTQELLRSDGVTLETLSPNEFLLLDHLINKKGQIVTREEIAQLFWKENYLLQYSDWAIDKTISTLRQKILDSKEQKIIKTIRSRGFVYR